MNKLPHATEPVAHNIDKDLLRRYSERAAASSVIDPELYRTYNVKRGLRNADGSGVLVGLTTVGSVVGYTMFEQELQPVPGRLFYRGVELRDLVRGFQSEHRFGFEETIYLLLFGKLPTKAELAEFCETLDRLRPLPHGFKEDVILGMPSPDVMNKLARCVLACYTEDPDPDSTAIENVVRQSLSLISRFPTFAVYGYQAKAHYYLRKSLHMRIADPGLSTAEHILNLLRPHGKFTRLEAELLDLCLVIHAEHGGGNNSTFTTHVVTSTGTDTYAAVSAALGSLKGPKHGGANIKVTHMMDEIRDSVRDWTDEDEVSAYVQKILDGDAFDRTGLVYGIGHAIYSRSDPRAEIFRDFVESLAQEKGLEKEFGLYSAVEKIAPRLISGQRKMYKGVSANVDFYSGFAYRMLGIPEELFTPLFAIARISGWCAHRIEELLNGNRIIRPSYKAVQERRTYRPLDDRSSR